MPAGCISFLCASAALLRPGWAQSKIWQPLCADAAVHGLQANDTFTVDIFFVVVGVALGAAGVLLAYLLVTCRQSGLAVMDVRHDNALDESTTTKEQFPGSNNTMAPDELQKPASLAVAQSAVSGESAADFAGDASRQAVGGSSLAGGLYRRPLARAQTHDSSSTVPFASSFGATSLASSSGRTSLGDTSSLAGSSVGRISSNASTTPEPPQPFAELARSSVPASGNTSAQALQAQQQQQQQQQRDGTDPGNAFDQCADQPRDPSLSPQSPAPERLIVPAWGMPPPRPLQAMSAPLTGLALSASSSQDLLPSMPSLSDPTVNAVRTPQKPAAQGRLPGSVAQQQAPPAAQQRQGGTGARVQAGAGSSRSFTGPSSSGAAADAGGVGTSAGAAHCGKAQQQSSDSHATAKAQMELAAVLAPGAAAGRGSAAARRLLPPGAAAAAATPAAAAHSAAAHVPLVRPIGTCLPAAPWSAAGAAGAASASNLLYGAAPARPLPTNALYKSPLQHVTLSVKVPTQFTPSAASNLQSMVARHVWAGESQLAGPNGEPRDPQHTILHMVSIPGCIQLFLTVAQWQPDQGNPAPGADSISSFAATAQAAAAGMQAAGAEASFEGEAMAGAEQGGALTGAPAPAWMVQAVCRAVEEFSRVHGTDAVLVSAASSGGSADQQAAGTTGEQHYTGPVLLNVNGVVHTLKPDAADAGAEWILQECSAPELAQLQAGPHLAHAATAAAAAAAAARTGQMPAVWQSSRLPAAAAAGGAAGAATPVPETPAALAALPALRTPITQPRSVRTSFESTQSTRSSSPTPAAARTSIRTIAQGVVGMHDQGSSGLFVPPSPGTVSTASTPAQADVASTGAGQAAGMAASSASLGTMSPVLNVNTSYAPATALPPGMWAWPLYLATTGGGSATAEARVAVCGSSAAVPVVALHGLPGRSCRVVLATSGGSVLLDKSVPVEDGAARFLAPESSTVRGAKIFYMLPPAAAADSASSTSSPGPAAAADTAPAAPAEQLLCMLPLLHLPPDAVVELCEAARALMLERSNLTFTQQLRAQHKEREQEAEQHLRTTANVLEESYTDNLSGGSSHLGTLSLTPGAAGTPGAAMGDLLSFMGQAAGVRSVADVPIRSGSTGHLGTLAQQLQAAEGTSRHEGSFDTTPASSATFLARPHSAPNASQGAARDPVESAAAGAQVLAGTSGPVHGPFLPSQLLLQQQQQQQQPFARPSSSGNRRASIESAVTAGNGSSGGSSIFDSRTGLEDEPGQLNLRGRLFKGSTDVHQLLNSQYLAILADLGLLIELAGPQPAAGSSSGPGVGPDSQHANMAAEVGQQLLVWFMETRCWSCCQLVLRLLLQLGVDLHMHGQPVTAAGIASATAVQQLLQGAAAAGAAVVSAQAPAAAGGDAQLGVLTVPTPVSAISRAGVWGHLPPEFPATAQSPGQPGYSRVSSAHPVLSHDTPAFGFSRTASGSSSAAAGAGAGSVCTGSAALPGTHHGHTSSASTSGSYISCSSAGSGGDPASPRSPAAAAAVHATAPRSSIVWPPYTPTPTAAAAAATAAATLAAEREAGVRVLQPEVPSGVSEHGSRRLSGMLDSASEMWTRLRRSSFSRKGKREVQQ